MSMTFLYGDGCIRFNDLELWTVSCDLSRIAHSFAWSYLNSTPSLPSFHLLILKTSDKSLEGV